MIYERLTVFFIDNFYDNKTIEKLSKKELFKIIIDYFSKERPSIIKDYGEDDIMRALIKRENVGSTGIGKGVAVPHTRHRDVTQHSVIFCPISKGIEFDALDGEPVYLIWLVLGPGDYDSSNVWLAILEKVSFIIRNAELCKLFKNAKNEKEVLDILIEAETPEFK